MDNEMKAEILREIAKAMLDRSAQGVRPKPEPMEELSPADDAPMKPEAEDPDAMSDEEASIVEEILNRKDEDLEE